MTAANDCLTLVDKYVVWLKKGISVEQIGDVCEITTPFLDRHNDHLQIYIQRVNGKYVLSDDGYTLADLRQSGVEFDTEKRKRALETVLRGFGVTQSQDRLIVETDRGDLPRRKHNLIQAMLAVNDLFIMGREHVASFFREDVEKYLLANNVRYVGMIKFAGRSGYDHTFDFAIPPSAKHPERLARAINIPNRDSVGAFIFAWNDVRQVRKEDAQAFAFLNDEDRNISADSIHALQAYEIAGIPWSRRNEFLELLTE
ncbi:MAG TPA: DUF1828 domain-containing protein [Anaerolineales bacterium]|nr:DUF1828 domain-containing protein [Anaerolineales bacterium]